MRSKLVIGNWKMNGSTAMANALVNAAGKHLPPTDRVEVAVLPPFPYLAKVRDLAAGSALNWGAQDVSAHDEGAHTGEVAAAMLAEFGCRFVLVGHSERRHECGEDDRLIAAKFAAARRAGLTPVLCVGETRDEREAGNTFAVVERQLETVADHNGIAAFAAAVVAYEPVWAIGTGLTATPEQAAEVHGRIRSFCAALDDTIAAGLRILYGGSVKPDNAVQLFAEPEIDGGLIGGASLNAEHFTAIVQAAASGPRR